jgi:hypothetical protein
MSFVELKSDNSAKALLASNLLTIAFALILDWNVMTLLWGYWLQSVIIGVFTVFKILLAKPSKEVDVMVSVQGPTIGGRRSLGMAKFMPTGENVSKSSHAVGKVFVAGFFCVHYGMFHFIYAIFLGSFFAFGPADWLAVGIIGLIFSANHLYSLAYNYFKAGKEIAVDIMQIFMAPYARIIPMHLTIIASGFLFAILSPVFIVTLMFGGAGLAQTIFEKVIIVVFLLIKTFADLKGHEWMHKGIK